MKKVIAKTRKDWKFKIKNCELSTFQHWLMWHLMGFI